MLPNRFDIYGFRGMIRLFLDLVHTKLFFAKSRIVRRPIEIRGRKFIEFSQGLTTGRYCRIEALPHDGKSVVLKIGKNVEMNDSVHITAMNSVEIGNNVLMAGKIYISDCSHGKYDGLENDSIPCVSPNNREFNFKKIKISDNVWIGEFVSVLPGVTIGKGSIIGANAVVTKDIPANCIAVGNPAKPIKQYNFETKKWETI